MVGEISPHLSAGQGLQEGREKHPANPVHPVKETGKPAGQAGGKRGLSSRRRLFPRVGKLYFVEKEALEIPAVQPVEGHIDSRDMVCRAMVFILRVVRIVTDPDAFEL